MRNYFLAERMKYRHTFLKTLPLVMPLVTVILAAWLTHAYFAVDSYNWWYMGLYPGFLGILCGMIGEKDKKKKNVTIGSLPCSMEKIWDAKIMVGALMSGIAMGSVTILTIIMGKVMENLMHVTFILQPSVKMQLAAGVVLWLTTLWEIPFCLFLSQKMGMFLMLLVHMGSYAIAAVAISLRPWFAMLPGAIPSRLMCPMLGILPNGLPAVEEQMMHYAELMGAWNLPVGILASVLWFLIFWRGSRNYFRNCCEGTGQLPVWKGR